jgi:hypothetical protein
MIKYLILSFIAYYIYSNYFPSRKIEPKNSNANHKTQNKSTDDYVDYEEVE